MFITLQLYAQDLLKKKGKKLPYRNKFIIHLAVKLQWHRSLQYLIALQSLVFYPHKIPGLYERTIPILKTRQQQGSDQGTCPKKFRKSVSSKPQPNYG